MRKKLEFLLVFFIWVLSMASLSRREVSLAPQVSSSYREFLPLDLILRDEWFGIYFGQQKIGYLNLVSGLESLESGSGYRIGGEAFLILPVLGTNERVWIKMNSHIDSEYKLKDFYFLFFPGRIKTELKASRIAPDKFKLELRQGESSSTTILQLPEGVVMGTFFGPPKELANPRVGKSMKFHLLNPLTLKPEEVHLEVIEKQEVEIGGKKYFAYLLKTEFSGLESKSWIDSEGRLLKEESPLGLVILREPQEKALSFLSDQKGLRGDIAEYFSLPSNLILEPSQISRLFLLLKGRNLDWERLSNQRQVVLDKKIGPNRVEVYLMVSSESREGSFKEEDLASSDFIQAQDPKIKAIAEYLVREKETLESRVKAILKWVYDYLEKKPTLSIPSALTALELREGDCNEHTFLFAALSRSVGIPTRINNGLVYINGRFYYHSWPAVYLDGKWVDVDPTLNQYPADPTHIMLVEGELAQQMDILKILGKIEIELKKYE